MVLVKIIENEAKHSKRLADHKGCVIKTTLHIDMIDIVFWCDFGQTNEIEPFQRVFIVDLNSNVFVYLCKTYNSYIGYIFANILIFKQDLTRS